MPGKLGGYNQRGGAEVQAHWLAAGYGYFTCRQLSPFSTARIVRSWQP